MAICRSCGVEITFIKMRKTGKQMPCDPGLIPFWADIKNGKDSIVTLDGEVVKCRLVGKPEEITNVGRIPHWTSCPNAAGHRRKP